MVAPGRGTRVLIVHLHSWRAPNVPVCGAVLPARTDYIGDTVTCNACLDHLAAVRAREAAERESFERAFFMT